MIVECPGCKRRYDVSGRPAGTRARCRCGAAFTLPEPPENTLALKCPNCGANARSTATRCGYCEADLAMRACPRCFGKLFLGTKFCPRCGAKSDDPARALADGNAAPRHCPRCGGGGKLRLESRLTGDVILDTCPGCSGMFLDNDLLERILAERRYHGGSQSTPGAPGSAPAPAAEPGHGPFYVKCPDCGAGMGRRLFASRSGVIVDVCHHHGTWLDANELHQLIAFVQAGGLDEGGTTTSFRSTALRPVTPPVAPPRPRRRASSREETSILEDVIEILGDLLD